MADGDAHLEQVIARAAELSIPVIVLGEYQYGIGHSRNHAQYQTWLTEIVSNCRVLSVDQDTAGEHASIRGELKRAGRPIPGNDLWIAALARQHAMPVVCRDAHFDFVRRLKRLSW